MEDYVVEQERGEPDGAPAIEGDATVEGSVAEEGGDPESSAGLVAAPSTRDPAPA